MTTSLEHTYTVERLKATDLLVDKRVQRDAVQPRKIDNIVKNFNPDALGVIHVSRRADKGDYVIDGWHRKDAVIRVTDGTGDMVAHVYSGLTLAQEAQMFLDLNMANQPNPLEKHKARVSAGDEQALRIERHVHAYGWTVSPVPAPGHVNAIQKLYVLDALSEKAEGGPLDPSLLQLTFLTITRAWSNDRYASQAVILEGIGRLFLEHRTKIDVDHLVDRLRNHKGGARKLHQEATQLTVITGGRVSMAVASLITEAYNKGKKDDAKSALPAWRKRN
jgi:hypothetical protein